MPERVQEWIAKAEDPEAIEFVVTIDEAQAAQRESLARLPRTRVFVNDGRRCCVDGWNLAARKARGDILIQCSDDLHVPDRWDVYVRDRLRNGEIAAVLAVSDGLTASSVFLPHAIMTRRYYNEFGYMFHDAYWSMWSDNEFSMVARLKKAVIDGHWIQFHHSNGQMNDDVRAQHDSPRRLAGGQTTYVIRQMNAFQPWVFTEFSAEDGDSDGIYSPNWRTRLAIYWHQSPRSADHYLGLHRDSLERRLGARGQQPPARDFEVLIPTVPQRRAFLDLLLAELSRQGISHLVDDRTGVSLGEKHHDLIQRSTAPYLTFIDDDGWISHNYAEIISDALASNRRELDVLLFDVLRIAGQSPPRGVFYSFDLAENDLPECSLRLPDHLMVWRRDVAQKEPFPSVSRPEDPPWTERVRAHVARWARVHGLLYFQECLEPGPSPTVQ